MFASRPGVETASAGLAPDAEEQCSAELVEWADIIFVMERAHRAKLQRRFRAHLKRARVICLDIPDVPDSACGASGMTSLRCSHTWVAGLALLVIPAEAKRRAGTGLTNPFPSRTARLG